MISNFTISVIFSLGLAVCAAGQSSPHIYHPSDGRLPNPRTPPTEEDILRGLLYHPAAFYRGVGHIQVHRMGDVAASAILGIMGTESLTEAQKSEALDIVHLAFEHLDSVRLQFRKPKQTLLLLNYLASNQNGQDLASKIISTKEFVTNARAKNYPSR